MPLKKKNCFTFHWFGIEVNIMNISYEVHVQYVLRTLDCIFKIMF